MKKLSCGAFLLTCLITIGFYWSFSSKLDIDKVVLKRQDVFKITNEMFEYKFDHLKNRNYNVVLKYLSGNEAEAYAMKKRTYMANEYNITVQVFDDKGNIVKSAVINDGSKLSSGWSQEYVEWYLLKFPAEDLHSYTLKILFKSRDAFFDKFIKEIYLVQDYDQASLPWWYLLRRVFLIIFIISFSGLTVTGLFLWRDKRRGRT